MIKRKDLEILLSKNLIPIIDNKIELEQYQTPPNIVANIVHRALMMGDIESKSVIDLCCGTGILGIAAAICGADIALIEIDTDLEKLIYKNLEIFDLNGRVIIDNALEWHSDIKYDTAIINPPFGIQQKSHRDLEFLVKANNLAKVCYSIVDGSNANQNELPRLLNKNNIHIIEAYLQPFEISKSYDWHRYNKKIHNIMILKTELK